MDFSSASLILKFVPLLLTWFHLSTSKHWSYTFYFRHFWLYNEEYLKSWSYCYSILLLHSVCSSHLYDTHGNQINMFFIQPYLCTLPKYPGIFKSKFAAPVVRHISDVHMTLILFLLPTGHSQNFHCNSILAIHFRSCINKVFEFYAHYKWKKIQI